MFSISRSQSIALTLFTAGVLLAAPVLATPVGVTVVVENRAPAGGTWLSPVWIGFHSGTFDIYDTGAAASGALESLAEDGEATGLNNLFDQGVPGGARDLLASGGEIPPLAPGQSVSRTFVLDTANPAHRYLSWASMVLPSNDAFIAPDDPAGHRVFDNGGNFLGGFINVAGSEVLDAGTEVNDEVPAHTAFFGQETPDSGDEQGGVVQSHAGFLPPGSGGILDDPDFAMADFTVPGYQMLSITLYRSDTLVPAGNVSGTWSLGESPYLVQGDITVPAGESLDLEPGVVVHVEDGHQIRVLGNLTAVGQEAAPILFSGPASGQSWRGLLIEGETAAADLEHCIVENANLAWNYEEGGGINCLDGSLELRHSLIRNNDSFLGGAGVFARNADLVISDCDIGNNHTGGTNSATGGGIFTENCQVEIADSRIHDNQVITSNSFGATNSRGGGLALLNATGSVERCIIDGNYITHSGTATESAGAGVYINGGGPTLRGNTIEGNVANYNNPRGGGIHVQGYSVQLVNNIVTGNTGSGIWFGPSSLNTIQYNDVWDNSPANFSGPDAPGGVGVISQTNANGDPCDDFFNISLDPRFVNAAGGDFHLEAASPCIDAGDPAGPQDPDGTVADIGALYFAQELSAVPGGDRDSGTRLMLRAGPAPMTTRSAISFSLPRASHVKLTVYDIRGRAVRTLLDANRPAGSGQVVFDGRDESGQHLPSGVYLYRMQAAGQQRTNKLSIVR